jgi:hypothetical protein
MLPVTHLDPVLEMGIDVTSPVVSDEPESPSLSSSPIAMLDMYTSAVLEWDEEDSFTLSSLNSDLMVDESHERSDSSRVVDLNIDSMDSVHSLVDERDDDANVSESDSFTGFTENGNNNKIVKLNEIINELPVANISNDYETDSDPGTGQDFIRTRSRGPVRDLPNVQQKTLERKYKRKK